MSDVNLAGTELGRYRLESLLGAGGMGRVYLGHHVLGGWKAAIKVMRPEFSEDADFRERFFDEARLAKQLDDPCVVTIHDLGEADGHLFIAMDYLPGGDLSGLLRREGRLSVDRTLPILDRVARALDAAHAKRLIHGDVKPANILLDASGNAYLTDLGLAQAPSSRTRLAGEQTFRGTPKYSAPEQIQGQHWDARTDVYGLGGVLYECLTGGSPFVRSEEMAVLYAHLNDPPPPLGADNPELAPFDPVVQTALAKDPEDRYRSCGDLVSDLRARMVPTAETQIAPPQAAAAVPPPRRPEAAPPAPTPATPVAIPVSPPPAHTPAQPAPAPPAARPPRPDAWKRWAIASGAGVSAVLLFASLFAPWFIAGGDVSVPSAEAAGIDVTANAWQIFTGFDLFFALTALTGAGFAIIVLLVSQRGPLLIAAAILLAAAFVSLVLVAIRLASPPDLVGFVANQIGGAPLGASAEGDPRYGIVLAFLALAGLIAAGVLVIVSNWRVRTGAAG